MASNKAMLFPFIAFRPKVANYCLVYYKDDLFYCDFFYKNNKQLLSNFKMMHSFTLDFHEVGISYFPGRGRPYTVLSQNH